MCICLCPLPPIARWRHHYPSPSAQGRMGKHRQRITGGGFGHELLTRALHGFAIAARIHPVRALHFTDIMEQVAEIVETLARGADTHDRMARRLTRAGYHADTWHNLALA